MSLGRSIVLGLLQGVTEFLPVSSSAHLILVATLFDWTANSLLFDTMLHFGTGLALLVYFRHDLLGLVKSKDWAYFLKLLVATLPAIVLGFFLDSWFEAHFRHVSAIASFLLLGSLVMLVAETWESVRSVSSGSFTYAKAFFVGLFQSLALFPGMSRSGSTLSGGLLMGLSRVEATRFSFLLAIPVVFGAGAYQLLKVFMSPMRISSAFWLSSVLGLGVSFIAGLLSIRFLMRYVRNHNLLPFVVYRVILALVLLLVF